MLTVEGALLPVYAQLPVRPVLGRGSWLVDEQGREWLDAYGGHAVASSGHSHPRVVRAIAEQAAKLLFYSAALPLPQRERLAERLATLCPGDLSRVFLCNSGAEANENALHLARRATGRTTVVTATGGWHGRTAATLALCDGATYEAGALRAGVALSRRATWNDDASLAASVDDTVAAVLLEPVQGIAGAREATPSFLRAARSACDRHGAALVFDEVQCGAGRVGTFTAAERYGVVPDVLTMAKGLAAGLPIGAVVATPSIVSGIRVGDLGSTFGGGPVPCAAALANLDVLEDERLLDNAEVMGAKLRAGALSLGLPVSGLGLLLGIRVPGPAVEVQRALLERRVISGTSADPAVLRWMPPLVLRASETDLLLEALAGVLGGKGR